jgi:putative ABC transport system ATP-binding protein
MQILVENLYLNQGDFSLFIKKWAVESRSHLLIEGPSGTGKTSVLHILAGLLKPSNGIVILDDQKISELPNSELCHFRKNNLGIIFQKIHLLPHLTLFENVLLGCQNEEQEKEIPALLERLGLKYKHQNLPHELSLGETQRASIARALISNPKLILADEPSASLDDENAEIVFKLLKEKAKDKTLLVVTHDHRARSYFDKVINFKELISK